MCTWDHIWSNWTGTFSSLSFFSHEWDIQPGSAVFTAGVINLFGLMYFCKLIQAMGSHPLVRNGSVPTHTCAYTHTHTHFACTYNFMSCLPLWIPAWHSGVSMDSRDWQTWVQILALLLARSMTLDKLFNILELQFSFFYWKVNTHLIHLSIWSAFIWGSQ